MRVYRTIAALCIALALVLIPLAAQAATIDFSVILGAGQWINGGHWAYSVDSVNVVDPNDQISYIVSKESAYLSPTGSSAYVEWGNIARGSGSSQYIYSRTPFGLTCVAPYVLAFGGYGCIGGPDQWGVARAERVRFEADWYPAPFNVWQFFVTDLSGTFRIIAQQRYVYGAFQNAKVGVAMVYGGSLMPVYNISTLFSHPLAWENGRTWIDIPTAYAAFTYTSLLDVFACPNIYSIHRFADKREFLISNSIYAVVDPVCNANPFWP